MKNIKVNIINHQGKKTSTTINVNIAVYYYRYCVPQADKEYIKDYDLEYQHDAAIAHRNKSLQDFVNQLIEKVRTSSGLYKSEGVDQQYIEVSLLNEIKFS